MFGRAFLLVAVLSAVCVGSLSTATPGGSIIEGLDESVLSKIMAAPAVHVKARSSVLTCKRFGDCELSRGACKCDGEKAMTKMWVSKKCRKAGPHCWYNGYKCTCRLGRAHGTCAVKGKKCFKHGHKCFCFSSKVKGKCEKGCFKISGKCVCKQAFESGCEKYGSNCFKKFGRCFCSLKVPSRKPKFNCRKFGKNCRLVKGKCKCKGSKLKPLPVQSPAARPAQMF